MFLVRWPSGKASVCKTDIRGFDSRPHLFLQNRNRRKAVFVLGKSGVEETQTALRFVGNRSPQRCFCLRLRAQGKNREGGPGRNFRQEIYVGRFTTPRTPVSRQNTLFPHLKFIHIHYPFPSSIRKRFFRFVCHAFAQFISLFPCSRGSTIRSRRICYKITKPHVI